MAQAQAIEALLRIKDDQDILLPKLDKEVQEIRALAAQALERAKKAEAHAEEIDNLNADLSLQNAALVQDMKAIEKAERKRRWRWLLGGIAGGMIVGLVAGLAAN